MINNLAYYNSCFNDFGFSVLPFWGKYNNKNYPMDYTEKEKADLNKYIAIRGNETFKVEPIRVKDKICRAGQIYAHIMPDGEVCRCGAGGDLISKNFLMKNLVCWISLFLALLNTIVVLSG